MLTRGIWRRVGREGDGRGPVGDRKKECHIPAAALGSNNDFSPAERSSLTHST